MLASRWKREKDKVRDRVCKSENRRERARENLSIWMNLIQWRTFFPHFFMQIYCGQIFETRHANHAAAKKENDGKYSRKWRRDWKSTRNKFEENEILSSSGTTYHTETSTGGRFLNTAKKKKRALFSSSFVRKRRWCE